MSPYNSNEEDTPPASPAEVHREDGAAVVDGVDDDEDGAIDQEDVIEVIDLDDDDEEDDEGDEMQDQDQDDETLKEDNSVLDFPNHQSEFKYILIRI